ncbi:internalin I-like [Mya arenaria]|uniref:internalin I-like n=1 Tax=Mya arenaria TaxID=6604 RepID=UPI0022E67A79|nr:internalin I-like [Mya arenaria]
MEARIKMQQPGTIPKSLGRQVGVLPISSGNKLRRANKSDVGMAIPVGGTDIDQVQSYQARPPSGSSAGSSRQAQSNAGRVGIRRTSSKGDVNIQDTVYSRMPDRPSERTVAGQLMKKYLGTANVNLPNPSPGDQQEEPQSRGNMLTVSSSRGKAQRTSPASSRTAGSEGTRKSSASKQETSSGQQSSRSTSSITNNSSTKGKRAMPGSRVKKSNSIKDVNDVAIEDDLEGQDIKFYDIPSQRSRPGSSKVRRSPGSARSQISDGHGGENGKKQHKTIDPEEILAQNMESDLNKIYEINLHMNELTHIDHMEKFKKVKVLDLSCNFIEQIQNLEFNKDLRELKLYDNRLRKIECLENLKELVSLQLQHNKIKVIGKSLSGQKKLKTLRIDCNQLLKIDPPELSMCVQITTLDISYNMLDSLAALNYLPNLEEVNAAGNRLRTVSDLSKCKRLGELDLSGNRITDLSGLRGLPKLNTLNISNNQLSSLKTLGKLRNLQDLLASHNHIHELSPIPVQLPGLETLDLTNNEIVDWDEFYHLDGMAGLVELFVAENPFCAPEGSMPHYFSAIQVVLPDLEIIDGAHIKKHVSKGAPLMRPMSASTIVSLRQMDSQMRSADDQMRSLERSLEEKFAALRSTCDSLPLEPPSSSRPGYSPTLSPDTPSSSCSSRSRILQARRFAATVEKP